MMNIPHAVRMALELSAVCSMANCSKSPGVTLNFENVADARRFMEEARRQMEPLLHPMATDLIKENEFVCSGVKFFVRPLG